MDIALFLHSAGTGPFMFARAAKVLSSKVRTVNQPNRGYPPDVPLPRGSPWTLEQEVDRALSHIPSDATRVHVFGHSWGGIVGLKLMQRPEAKIASLWTFEPALLGSLLADPLTRDHEAATEVRQMIDHPWFIKDESRAGSREWLELFLDYSSGPGVWQATPPELQDFTLEFGWKISVEVKETWRHSVPFASYCAAVPVTVVYGENTSSGMKVAAQALHGVLPNAKLEAMAGMGHMGPLTHAPRVLKSIEEHFARVSGR